MLIKNLGAEKVDQNMYLRTVSQKSHRYGPIGSQICLHFPHIQRLQHHSWGANLKKKKKKKKKNLYLRSIFLNIFNDLG